MPLRSALASRLKNIDLPKSRLVPCRSYPRQLAVLAVEGPLSWDFQELVGVTSQLT
jgi:hypothetical protein